MTDGPGKLTASLRTTAMMLDSSTSTIRRRLKDDPDFPTPFRLTPKGELMWLLEDIQLYVARKASRPVAASPAAHSMR